jgi:hypothetical protein
MSQQLINTGLADKGNGDPIRTAFTKVNENFAELYNQVASGVVVSATAPTGPEEGSLWWDSESGRIYVYYNSTWVDASPVDGAGISSTNELVNGAYTVSLGTDGTTTFPDNLTVANGIIGKNSTDTITEEDPAGITTQTTVIESQIEIEASGIVIAKRIIQTFDDGVVTAVDNQGSVLTLNNSVASIKRYADPAGPNNIAYSQFTTDGGAVIETVQEDIGGTQYGRVNATLGSVQVSAKSEIGDQKYWLFNNDGSLTLPNNSTISPVEQAGYNYGPYATDIYNSTTGGSLDNGHLTIVIIGVAEHNDLFNAPTAPASTVTGTIAANGDFEPGTPTTGTFTRFTLILINGQSYGSLGYRDDENPSAGLRIGQQGDTYEGGTIPAGIRIDGWRGRQTVAPKTTTYIKWADGSSTQITGSQVQLPNSTAAGIITADDVRTKSFPATIYTANYSVAKTAIGVSGKQWGFGTDGSLTVPSPTSTVFTLTFADTSYVATGEKPTLTLTGDPWELHGQYVYASDGRSSLMLDNPFPILTNPGYDTSDSFTFGSDVHGIVGYTLTITLDNVVEEGPAGWTANVIASAAPAYPSTILTSGAIKLTTNNNSNWIFGTDGLLTFPGAAGFQATFGSVEPVGDVLHSVNSLYLESELTVGLTSGNQITDLETAYNDQLTALTSLLSAELYGTSFLPASHDSIIALAAAKAINPLISDQIITVAIAVSDAWDAWQSARTSAGVLINVADKQWVFGVAGDLRVPGTINKTNILQLNSSGTGDGAGNTASVSIDGFNGRLLVRTGDSETNKDWTFGTDGELALPTNGYTEAVIKELDATALVLFAQSAGGNIKLLAGATSAASAKQWLFNGTDGSLTLAGSLELPEGNTITDNRSFIGFSRTADYTSGSWGGDNVGFSNASISLQHELSLLESGDFISLTTVRTGTITATVANVYTGGAGGSLTVVAPVYGSGDSITSIALLDRTASGIELTTHSNTWTFGQSGELSLPAGGDVINSTGVSQLANRVEGSWTVATGTATYSFTVPSDGTYTMWVKGNIPNGIITWNATLSITNSNVPAIGQQYAWNYTGGGTPISLTAIPDQIRGSSGVISTDATYVGTTSNRFDFGISNSSGSSQTIYYGYTKV